jgi:hypothetical protein
MLKTILKEMQLSNLMIVWNQGTSFKYLYKMFLFSMATSVLIAGTMQINTSSPFFK